MSNQPTTTLTAVKGITETFPSTTSLQPLSRIDTLEQRKHKILQMPEGDKKAYWLKQVCKELKIARAATL